MKSIKKNLTKIMSSGLLATSMIIGLAGCSGSSSKALEMSGVKFTPELTRKELKKGIAGQSPDDDDKESVSYDDIELIDGIPGELYVSFKPNGKLDMMQFNLGDNCEDYKELYENVVKQVGEPDHKENINDFRNEIRCYWRLSDDMGLTFYRDQSWKDHIDGFYTTYIKVSVYSEKEQKQLAKRQKKYDEFTKKVEKDEKLKKELKNYLKLLNYKDKPVNQFIKECDAVYDEDSYSNEIDFIAKTELMGEKITVRAELDDSSSTDGQNGKINFIRMELDNDDISRKDKKLLDKFVPIFGEWEWDSEEECAYYDNGLFETGIDSCGLIDTTFDDYETIDAKYMVSTSTKKYRALKECDVDQYVDSDFNSSGQTYSTKGDDIVTALETLSDNNQFGWELRDKTPKDGTGVAWHVYKNGEDTGMLLAVFYDSSNNFQGLIYGDSNGSNYALTDDDLATELIGITFYTDANLSLEDARDTIKEALANETTIKNGRAYKISVENDEFNFAIAQG